MKKKRKGTASFTPPPMALRAMPSKDEAPSGRTLGSGKIPYALLVKYDWGIPLRGSSFGRPVRKKSR